ncbi:MAG: RNA polymerase sigma factor, partial [Planctomycetota bacterium]
AVIRANINDKSQQEDIFQDFFISLVHRPIPKYIDNVKGYICRAVKNDIYDAKRKTINYRSRISKHAHCVENTHKQQTPQDIAIKRELKQNITRTIEQLLPRHEANAIFDRFCINNTSLEKDYKKTHKNKRTLSRYVCVGLKNEQVCMRRIKKSS